jgi:TPR repeat protein
MDLGEALRSLFLCGGVILCNSLQSIAIEDDPLQKKIFLSKSVASEEVYRICYIKSLSGDAEAQYKIGLMYELGIGVQSDAKKSFQYILRSAENGFSEAQYQLALKYRVGYGVLPEVEKVHYWALRAFRQNNLGAILLLAELYHLGEGVSENHTRAFYLLNYASSLGSSEANLRLGRAFLSGKGIGIDRKTAKVYFEKAAHKKVPEAWLALGEMYMNSGDLEYAKKMFEKSAKSGLVKAMLKLIELESWPNKSFEWMMMAAELGDVNGIALVAQAYENGVGVRYDLEKSFEWYKKAAIKDHAPSQLKLGNFYLKGYGCLKSVNEAAIWYRRAFDLGLEEAALKLASLVNESPVLEQKYGKVMDLYSLVSKGNAKAQYLIGKSYLNSSGNGIDFAAAANAFRRSKALPQSAYELGKMIFEGLEVGSEEEALGLLYKSANHDYLPSILELVKIDKDSIDKRKWLTKAAKLGDRDSFYNYSKLLKSSGDEIDEKQSNWWLRKAVDAGQNDAKFEYGLQLIAASLETDRQRGRRFIQESARNGVVNAMLYLGQELLEGNQFGKSPDEGESWLEQASLNGSAEARIILQKWYFKKEKNAVEEGLP